VPVIVIGKIWATRPTAFTVSTDRNIYPERKMGKLLSLLLVMFAAASPAGSQEAPKVEPGLLASQLKLIAKNLRSLDDPYFALSAVYGPKVVTLEVHQQITDLARIASGMASSIQDSPRHDIPTPTELYVVFNELDDVLLQAGDAALGASLLARRENDITTNLETLNKSVAQLRMLRFDLKGEVLAVIDASKPCKSNP
jgi:hypothetical protein